MKKKTILLKYLKIEIEIDRDLKIILLDHQNNIGNSSVSNAAKSSTFNLNVLHNYFDSLIKFIFRSVSN